MDLHDAWMAFLRFLGFDKEKKKKKEPKPLNVPRGTLRINPGGSPTIDGKSIASIGQYQLLFDAAAYPDRAMIQAHLQRWADAGVNLIRVFFLGNFGEGQLAPWQRTPDGRYDLEKISNEYIDRMIMISDVAHACGLCVRWDVIDFWAMRSRRRGAIWALNPDCHVDPVPPPIGRELDRRLVPPPGFTCANDYPMSRHLWKHNSGMDFPVGAFDHSSLWAMYRVVANVAQRNGDIVGIANELFTEPGDKQIWDIPALQKYVNRAVWHIRDTYPGAIIALSTGALQAEALYPMVDLADVHGVSSVGDIPEKRPNLLPAVAQWFKTYVPGIRGAFSNTDGGQDLPRTDPTWIANHYQECWRLGLIPEAKADGYNDGIAAGIRQVRFI